MSRKKAPTKAPSPSVRARLREAFSTLTSRSNPSPVRATVSSLCRLAGVSRNTVYRYYPELVESLRRLPRRRGIRQYRAREERLRALRSEIAALHLQVTRLATLADHYHTEATELRALVARRDRELATLRAHQSERRLGIAVDNT